VPEIVSFIVEHPTSEGPYGAKGIGELPTIPVAPAVANGVYHAVGTRIRRLPLKFRRTNASSGPANSGTHPIGWPRG